MNFFWACCCVVLLFVSCGKKKNVKLADTYFRMGFLEMSGGRETEQECKRALAHIDVALKQDQKPEYYAFKATLLFKLGSYDDSEKFFKKALSAHPAQDLRAEIMNNYACLLAHKGDVVRAQEIWAALGRDTAYQTPEVAWVNIGKTYVEVKNLVGARDAFAKAAHISPSYVDAHFYLAWTANALGQDALAHRELDIVLSLEPEHHGALALSARSKKCGC